MSDEYKPEVGQTWTAVKAVSNTLTIGKDYLLYDNEQISRYVPWSIEADDYSQCGRRQTVSEETLREFFTLKETAAPSGKKQTLRAQFHLDF